MLSYSGCTELGLVLLKTQEFKISTDATARRIIEIDLAIAAIMPNDTKQVITAKSSKKKAEIKIKYLPIDWERLARPE